MVVIPVQFRKMSAAGWGRGFIPQWEVYILELFRYGLWNCSIWCERGCEDGMAAKDAAKKAQKEGAKSAKLATWKAKRIIGPIISSEWDFFEAIYYGGTITEGFLRGTGTSFGLHAGGFFGEQRFGRFGYLVGSQLGSWVGGRIGLMVYDVANGVHYLVQLLLLSFYMSSEASEDSNAYETLAYESYESYEDSELRCFPLVNLQAIKNEQAEVHKESEK
nr:hypothetical protein CFP56_38489 [Quercus suber]